VDLVARSLNTIAFTHQLRGDWDATEPPAAEAAKLFEGLADRAMEADSRCYVAAARIALGDHTGGIALARQALAASRAIDNPWGIAHSAHHLAWGLLDAGEYCELLDVGAIAVDAARSIRFAPLLCLNLIVLGAARRAILDRHAAVELHQRL
jgi:hypothetical protein